MLHFSFPSPESPSVLERSLLNDFQHTGNALWGFYDPFHLPIYVDVCHVTGSNTSDLKEAVRKKHWGRIYVATSPGCMAMMVV